jgi:hypothetical protein
MSTIDDPKLRGIIDNKKRKIRKGWMESAEIHDETKIVGSADRFWADPENRAAFGLPLATKPR